MNHKKIYTVIDFFGLLLLLLGAVLAGAEPIGWPLPAGLLAMLAGAGMMLYTQRKEEGK